MIDDGSSHVPKVYLVSYQHSEDGIWGSPDFGFLAPVGF